MTKVKCQYCNKEIDKDPHFPYERYYNIKFCSNDCCAKSRKGKPGIKHTEETKKKISKNHYDISSKNNPMFGKQHSLETKNKMMENHWNNSGINNFFYGKQHTKETKRKMRLQRIQELKQKGILYPNYNLKACKYFKEFDEENNTNGQYATNGGEYHIKELGYWPDYINFNLKLIMEWDELSHYSKGKLKDKDINRQKEIQNFFPDFKFERIKQIDME